MKKRVYGITYLKAFLPFLVIAYHERPFGESPSMILPLVNTINWKDIIYTNILSLAVPIFFMISFYLYLEKRDRIDYSPFKLMRNRVVYFLGLFIVWRIIFGIFDIGQFWNTGRGGIRNIYHLIFAGGDTLLYYLEHMMYYIVFLELFYYFMERFKLKKKVCSIVGIGISVIVLLIVTYFGSETLQIEALRYFSPLGFLPYIFIAAYLYESKEENHRICISITGIIGVICAVAEWKLLLKDTFLLNGYSTAIPSYARVSVIFLSSVIFTVALRVKRKPSKAIEWMSAISLYVYCIHQLVIQIFVGAFEFPQIQYVLVVVVTYAIGSLLQILKQFWREKKEKMKNG